MIIHNFKFNIFNLKINLNIFIFFKNLIKKIIKKFIILIFYINFFNFI